MQKGDRLRELRESKKLTQEELAKLLHTKRQTISKYEKGIVTNIPSDRIEALAKILDTTPEYILGWDQMEPGEQKNSDDIVAITDKLFRNADFLSVVMLLAELDKDQLRRAKEIISLAFEGNKG